MFKKFNYQLNHNPVGGIWSISLVMLLACLFIWSIDSEGIIPKKEAITMIFGYATIFNFVVSTHILIKSGNAKEVKLCKHDWEFIDKNEVTTVIGCAVDIDMVYTYQCKSCLEVRKLYRLWEDVKNENTIHIN